ncbi:helix-turn-helix domain-containing protein [Cellulomonas sp. JH27-2]|uniref:IclR family transcriptional regulator domain-containing protein n=1 Tax=Cellulomonas sp. JH27-2 TaxID=2774139 RepID=UPI0017839D74|nr:IclR family transcriptional regulator C-terminal domain-containing protein [Cellulomonas sp. JH27-2]MBD8059366.1 helix-turn-helix domain-containing protein [Cellulomonas sp. JH27-2]
MTSVDDGTVLGRATLVLELVESAGCITQADLARRSLLPKATVRRIAGDLTRRGLLTRCLDGYELGPRLASLGATALAHHPLRSVSTPHLQDLLERTRQVTFAMVVEPDLAMITLHLAFGHERAASGTETLARWPGVEHAEPALLFKAAGRVVYADHPDRVDALLAAGVRRPTRYSAPTRRALLAAIQESQHDGCAVERQEHTLGWSCVAAGIRDGEGRVVGVVGVTGQGAWEPDRFRRPLVEVATALRAAVPLAGPEARRVLAHHRATQ